MKTRNDGIFIASSGICPTWSYHSDTSVFLVSLLSWYSKAVLRVFADIRIRTSSNKMQQEPANSTLNFIDLSINKSIDFIATTFRQLFQLIFCFLLILVVGKIINFFTYKTQHAENEINPLKEEIDVEIEPEAHNEQQPKVSTSEPSGWDSEPIREPPKALIEVHSSNVTAKTMKKQFKRKCLSVGPIMLTPNSQIIRTLDCEEREERFRYDILPLDTSTSTTTESTTAENVCVPCWFSYL